MTKLRPGGFTLVEMVVTVLIIAILAAIAYPAYQDHLRKGRRTAAQALMMEAANRQQQYLLDARAYLTGAGAANTLAATPTTVSTYYTVTIAAGANNPSFIITATPQGAQLVDGTLTLDDTGAKTRAGVSGW